MTGMLGWRVLSIVATLFGLFPPATSKWVEGHLKTTQNWAFLARFCFLSYDGQFEYQIEFNRDIGIPNLLLYYDDESQWPSVYHSNKTCAQKEAVLNRAGQNQIISLSHWYPENDFSGCVMKPLEDETPSNNSNPNKKGKNKTDTTIKRPRLPVDPNATTRDPLYFNQFLISTTSIPVDLYSSSIQTIESLSTTESGMELIEDPVEEIEGSGDVEVFGEFAKAVTVEMMHKNNSEEQIDLTDVEIMFDLSENRSKSILKRSALRQYDTTRVRKFNPAPQRPARAPGARLMVMCRNARRFRSVRERWWFIAISNCGESKGLDVKYKFLMTNGPPGDYWHEHFSADEFYVLPILMAFCFAYVLVLIALVMCSVELKTRQMLHTTYKLFLVSVSLQQGGIMLQSMAYVKYAVNGVGGTNTKVLGQLLCGLSEVSYLLLLVLMAKGYTITRARLKVAFTIKLTVFVCSYLITYTSLFIYQAQMFDPGEVLYLYESPAGYGLIVLRICGWFMFVYAIVFTIKKYPEKSIFYYPFSLCGTLWFFGGPLFILTANNYIDKWVRESVVIAVLMFITFCGHISFLLLTLPVFANKNFPYHVRTTQIGVMEVVGMAAGNSTVDHFSHNIYTPYSQSVIIPLTRRTEELFGSHQCMATAPPLHTLDGSRETTVSFISGNSLGVDNIGPKLSISTQHSTESISSDKQKPLEEERSDSMENRFVPPKTSEALLKKEAPESNDDLKTEHLSENGNIFYIDNQEGPEYSYKDDPNYIKDVNNPFLVGASFKARKGLLEPIVRKDAYDVPPPKWSLAKSGNPSAEKNRKDLVNGIKKTTADYKLQGVIGTFPLPQIPRSAERRRAEMDAVINTLVDTVQDTDILESPEKDQSSQEDSLQILQESENCIDETILALYPKTKHAE